MELSNEISKICKQRMLNILQFFMKFCDKHSLTWYCCGGTALGAVRHHGFIPWDDDIDVMMPRPDYDRFIRLFKEELVEEYELIYPEITNSFYLPFCKIMEKNSTILERRKTPCVLGLFVDVFPIDGFPDPSSDEAKHFIASFGKQRKMLSEVSSHENLLDIAFLFSKFQLKKAVNALNNKINRKKIRKSLLKEMEDAPYNYPFDSQSDVVVREFPDAKRPFKKDWLAPYVLCDFEDIKVRIPNNCDAYLKSLYGDYMQLPPLHERISAHMEDMFYFNLHNRMTYDEIMNQTSWQDRYFGKKH